MAHIHILGTTGVGKSTHAKHLIHSAIARGDGLLFLTPHAEDATDLLDTIPKKRRKDTFLFDPTDFPLNLNPLDVSDERQELVADAIVGAVRSNSKMADASTANMDMTVHSCAMSLMQHGGNLLDITTMLTDKRFRQEVTDSTTNDAGKEHWAWVDTLDQRQFGDITRSTYNKFYQLKAVSSMRQVFGHSRTKLDVFEIVHENKILIARLPNGKLGSNKTKLVGNLLLSLVQAAGMSRTIDKPFWIVADEMHWWAPDIFQEVLTGGRKFGLFLIGINQFASQLNEELFDALKGNAESHVFRVAEDDARRYQVWFPQNAMTTNLEELPAFTYRKFPWLKHDKDVEVEPFEPERFPDNRRYIEETMRRNFMGD